MVDATDEEDHHQQSSSGYEGDQGALDVQLEPQDDAGRFETGPSDGPGNQSSDMEHMMAAIIHNVKMTLREENKVMLKKVDASGHANADLIHRLARHVGFDIESNSATPQQ